MTEPIVQSIVFGFGYRARSGKDTVAAMIREARGIYPERCLHCETAQQYHGREDLSCGNCYDIRIYGFAHELKREVTENALKSGGMRNLFSDGLRLEGCGYMQENGNILALPEWVQYDPDAPMDDPLCPLGKQRTLLQFWGTQLRRSVNQDYWVNKVAQRIAEEKPEVALITDVRFPNEVNFCQKYGEVVLVDRPSLPRLAGAAGVHASELALANFRGWDAAIKNTGSLEDLRTEALFTFDSLMSSVPSQRSTFGVN